MISSLYKDCVLKLDFKNHKGRPGQRGGSLPRSAGLHTDKTEAPKPGKVSGSLPRGSAPTVPMKTPKYNQNTKSPLAGGMNESVQSNVKNIPPAILPSFLRRHYLAVSISAMALLGLGSVVLLKRNWYLAPKPGHRSVLDSSGLSSIMKEERNFMSAPKEEARIFDMKGNILASHTSGQSGSVRIPWRSHSLAANNVVSHNHPGGNALLSTDDVLNTTYLNMAEGRAVAQGKDGAMYISRLIRPVNGWPSTFRAAITMVKFESKIANVLDRRYGKIIKPLDPNAMDYYEQMVAYSQRRQEVHTRAIKAFARKYHATFIQETHT
jgi:hypothetical protein